MLTREITISNKLGLHARAAAKLVGVANGYGADVILAGRDTEDLARTAADLMVRFHRHLRDGVDPVRALRRARGELAASGAHPAYWAPFTVVLAPARALL